MPAYYFGTLPAIIHADISSVLGALERSLAQERFTTTYTEGTLSWDEEIRVLQNALSELVQQLPESIKWTLLLEFPIPRRQKRVDAVILAHNVVFALEFKRSPASTSAYEQVWDYALDLVDFHLPSHALTICPVVVAPSTSEFDPGPGWRDRVLRPRFATPDSLATFLASWAVELVDTTIEAIDAERWNHGLYKPVPTIVEAALAVFAGMEVREIAHSHAEARNLLSTVDRIVHEIGLAHAKKQKVICFITGVPGAGKTLAGLRAVHSPEIRELTGSDPHFMSGNGPLVTILREALTRDRIRQTGATRAEVEHTVETLIQNVHIMAREQWDDPAKRPPEDRIIVFDEAQRAWNAKQNLRKFKRDISEPQMLLEIMDRHPDWAVIVALVGGGQEIHDGEAGLAEWGDALNLFPHWKLVSSQEALEGGPSVAGSSLMQKMQMSRSALEICGDFHLPIATRSYKAQALAEWVNAIMNDEFSKAARLASQDRAPLALVTRNLDLVKARMRQFAQGTARYGLIASSGATRLRAYGIETSTSFHRAYPYEYWFLNGHEDVRSSFQLEVAATEFEIQGLELDISCLCWGGDLIYGEAGWVARSLTSVHWTPVRLPYQRWRVENNPEKIQFAKNSYRVLLTRARQQLFIWVPPGILADKTNSPDDFDGIYRALLSAGAVELS